MSERPSHVILSAHLDDAVLSLGAFIQTRVARGEPALVITLCAGIPPPGASGPLAQSLFRGSASTGEEYMRMRREEDRRALDLLGVAHLWERSLDVIFRRPEQLAGVDSLFPRSPDLEDPIFREALDATKRAIASHPGATFYAPLAVGLHIDHQALSAAGQAIGAPVLWYEDFPYTTKPGALEARLALFPRRLEPHPQPLAHPHPLAHPQPPPTPDLSAQILTKKIDAVAEYKTQLAPLFGSEQQMALAVRSFTEGLWSVKAE